MSATTPSLAALAVCLLCSSAAEAAAPSRFADHLPARLGAKTHQVVASSEFGKASPDSFALYGGPGSLLGKFQDAVGNADWQGWTSVDLTDGVLSMPVGDFAKLFDELTDIDICRQNDSPQITFIDDGSDPNNLPGQSTGGSTSGNWSYGSKGGWVVNFTGGASAGLGALHNEVWSPAILWDDPTTTADDALVGGCVLRYTVWEHLPLENGIFHTWAVRSFNPAGGWTQWDDRGFVYFSDTPTHVRQELQIADLLRPGFTQLQIALGVVDLADQFGLSGNDATPSPWFDQVSVWRHDVDGPVISVNEADRFQDGWPVSSFGFDPFNLANSVQRMDCGVDLGIGSFGPVFGDSMVLSAISTIPGVAVSGPPEMFWFLRTNPLFDSVRSLPSGSTQLRPDLWSGSIFADVATKPNGVPVPGLWAFDLPDGPPRPGVSEPSEAPMFYPGDLLLYAVTVFDTNGGQSWYGTLPDTTSIPVSEECGGGGAAKPRPSSGGGGSGDPGSLPGIWDGPSPKLPGYVVPRILVWDDGGDPEELLALQRALFENGVLYARDYDIFHTTAPNSGQGNGLGGRAGSAEHLRDYDILFYLANDATGPLLSDGTGIGTNDRSNDIGILNAWRLQPGDRHAFYFADNMASAMAAQSTLALAHIRGVLGVDLVDDDITDDLGTLAPTINPALSTTFSESFVANAGCEPRRRFDRIEPYSGGTAVAGHVYAATGIPASVWHDRMQTVGGTGYRRLDVTFPYAVSRLEGTPAKTPAGLSARSLLIGELLTAVGHPINQSGRVDTPSVGPLRVGAPWPNPFNPTVVLPYVLDESRHVSARVFDLRGRRVATLLDEVAPAGRGELRWNGIDAAGTRVASGMYLIRVETAGRSWVRKVVLAK